jgi:cytochrome c oxidase cbb3-type subunit 3
MSSLYHHPERALAATALLIAAFGLSGCHEANSNPAMPAAQGQPLDVPVGGNFPAGESKPPLEAIAKQYQHNVQAVSDGSRLFDWYNCSGCHFHGAGGIGPPFYNDGQWLYGGRLDQIYDSIYQGRPNGMPMWGNLIPSSAIWELAAYVKSLSTKSASEPIPTKPVAGVPGPATLETEPDQPPPTTPAASQ